MESVARHQSLVRKQLTPESRRSIPTQPCSCSHPSGAISNASNRTAGATTQPVRRHSRQALSRHADGPTAKSPSARPPVDVHLQLCWLPMKSPGGHARFPTATIGGNYRQTSSESHRRSQPDANGTVPPPSAGKRSQSMHCGRSGRIRPGKFLETTRLRGETQGPECR